VVLHHDPGGRTRAELRHLRAWRLKKLLSQDELSQKSGVAKAAIVRLETGQQHANLATVGKLAAALGIKREQLVYEDPGDPKATGVA